MPQTVVFVHGYSVRSLGAYGNLPFMLIAEGLEEADVVLSAFDSLDNQVTCDDLAGGLEDRVKALEAAGLKIETSAFVVHSTGAIITRRWILNRVAAGKPIPSHFVSMAGANHGSTLAQLGVTIYAKIVREFQGADGVGQRVLVDLDYGSEFLRRLNHDWLKETSTGTLARCWSFSMIGDDHSALQDQFFWQTREAGSDSTVRICSGNLNYSWLDADPDATPPVIGGSSVRVAVPHLILHGFSHTGDLGILDSVKPGRTDPFDAMMQAFRVVDEAGYEAVRIEWARRTQAWTDADPDGGSSMIVFHLADEAGRPIGDNLIVLADAADNATALSDSLQKHQPIQNASDGSAVSFYLKQRLFIGLRPHSVHIEARSGSPIVDYHDIDYAISPDLAALVRPNETTYVEVRLNRNVAGTYRLVPYSPELDLEKQWPPLP